MTVRFLIVLLLVLIVGCDATGSDEPAPAAAVALVANGGNFSDQNGSVSRLDLAAGAVQNGGAMEGFLQAVEFIEGGSIALINTFSGGRVDLLGPDGSTVVGSVRDIDSPRDVVVIGERAYVTAFSFDGSGKVLTMNLGTGALEGAPLEVGDYPEGIAATSTHLFVAEAGFIGAGTTMSAIDLATGMRTSLDLACDGPRDVLTIPGDDVAVVCHGKTVYNADFTEVLERTTGQVVFVDGATLTIEDHILLDTQLGSTGGGQAGAASLAYLLALEGSASTIHRVDLATRSLLPSWTLGDQTALAGVSGITSLGDGWLVGRMARAAGGSFPDFTASGSVLHLDVSGSLLNEFVVGPAPTHLATEQP
ncbi:MAG: hypothetical protein HKN29_16825 [Rhodothermales bacterium]|nr:hypothetical protein [Rhodothermales bacterium]